MLQCRPANPKTTKKNMPIIGIYRPHSSFSNDKSNMGLLTGHWTGKVLTTGGKTARNPEQLVLTS